MSQTAVVIPTYRSGEAVALVVNELRAQGFEHIIAVDDCCPDDSTRILINIDVKVVKTPENLGVGGAFLYGVEQVSSLFNEKNIKYIAKIDSDGQHNPEELKNMCLFMSHDSCDMLKGNRYLLGRLPKGQPFIRKFGNAGLSFLNKLSTGFWHIDDPVNGMLLLNRKLFDFVSKSDIHNRYLFESSLLSSISRIDGVVHDFPTTVIYGDEVSSLSVKKEFFRFLKFHIVETSSRLVRQYFYPKFDPAAIGIIGSIFFPIGVIEAFRLWVVGILTNTQTEPGEIGLILILILIGFISLVFFLQRDQSKVLIQKPVSRYFSNND
jgi:glycosyltransferase involved in cell wall biosynthesis